MVSRGMVPIYFDTEFTGLHQNTTLISIGMISQSGAKFYAEFNDYDESQVTPWINDNVINNLILKGEGYDYIADHWEASYNQRGYNKRHLNTVIKGNTEQIKARLLSWLRWEYDTEDHKKLQFYSDCLAYDWVLLNSILCDGDATTLPDFLYYIPIDLSTVLQENKYDPDVSRESLIYHQEDIKNELLSLDKEAFKDVNKHNSLWDACVIKGIFDRNFLI